jgi:hypothetical protein
MMTHMLLDNRRHPDDKRVAIATTAAALQGMLMCVVVI